MKRDPGIEEARWAAAWRAAGVTRQWTYTWSTAAEGMRLKP